MKKLIIIIVFIFGIFFASQQAQAYGECTQYGFMSYYDSLSNSCKCYSGYVFGNSILGSQYCISTDSYCTNILGYSSRYNILTDSCECNYGYANVGGTCKSLDSICYDTLGLMSRYDSLSDTCECMSGYVIDTNMLGGKSCVSGTTYCHNKHGIYSSYTSYQNKCECDYNYTFDENNQCVKKQHNVYFDLKDLNTDDREAVIKSEYDYSNYHIKYSGCFSSTIKKYLNDKIVVNLGTDYDLDTSDYIVLFNDNETCDITYVDSVSSSYTLQSEDSAQYIIIPNIPTNNTNLIITNPEPEVILPVNTSYIEKEKSLVKNKSASLTNKLKGKILLQVESVGEAWYVNPTDGMKYYLQNGAVAYEALKKFGAGISNVDIAKIPIGVEKRFSDVDTDGDGLANQLEEGLKTDPNIADTDGDGVSDGKEVLENNTNPLGDGSLVYSNALANRFKGRILLQVQSYGEAWYVSPDDGKRYYMKNGEAAYQIMRFLSLGINNDNLRKIGVGEL